MTITDYELMQQGRELINQLEIQRAQAVKRAETAEARLVELVGLLREVGEPTTHMGNCVFCGKHVDGYDEHKETCTFVKIQVAVKSLRGEG